MFPRGLDVPILGREVASSVVGKEVLELKLVRYTFEALVGDCVSHGQGISCNVLSDPLG